MTRTNPKPKSKSSQPESPPAVGREPLWNEKQVADYTGISLSKLRKMRMRGAKPGLPFTRLGRSVRYRPSDIDRWVLNNLVGAVAAPSVLRMVANEGSPAGFTIRELLSILENLHGAMVLDALASPPPPPPDRPKRPRLGRGSNRG